MVLTVTKTVFTILAPHQKMAEDDSAELVTSTLISRATGSGMNGPMPMNTNTGYNLA